MNKKDLSLAAHNNAVAKGFWDDKFSNEHYLTLVFTEVAEAVEADRKGHFANVEAFKKEIGLTDYKTRFDAHIKNTVEDELADVYIRLLDLAGYLELSFDDDEDDNKEYNHKVIEFMKEITLTEAAFYFISHVTDIHFDINNCVKLGMDLLDKWAKLKDIDLEFHIKEKMQYNSSREPKHGKKY